MSEFVYFISYPDGPIKIGMAKNVIARLRALQTGCAFRLEVLGTMVGGASLEADLHATFEKLRLEGEWFLRHKNLLEFISKNTHPPHGALGPATDLISERDTLRAQLDLARSEKIRLRELAEDELWSRCFKKYSDDLMKMTTMSIWDLLYLCADLQSALVEIERKDGGQFSGEVFRGIRRVVDRITGCEWQASQNLLGAIRTGDKGWASQLVAARSRDRLLRLVEAEGCTHRFKMNMLEALQEYVEAAKGAVG